VVLALFAGWLLTACADAAECDDDQVLQGGSCIPDALLGSSNLDAGPSGGGDGDGVEPIECPAENDGGVGFATPCQDDETHSDCACPAPYCAIQPGETEGICTQVGCVLEPSICPGDWSCLDLSLFDPSAPPICVE
jgi:hypothetical protein